MNYGFSMSKFDIEKYVKQVSGALEKRAELISREKYPELWEKTDKMNSGRNPVEKSCKGQRLRVCVAGLVCLVLGVILVVPGFLFGETSEEMQKAMPSKEKVEEFFEKNEEINRMAAGLSFVVQLGKEKGVTVTVEDFDDRNSPLAGMHGISWFLQQVPELSYTLDTGNFLFYGERVSDAFELLRDRIAHVHCKDRHPDTNASVQTGSGYILFGEILGKLKEQNYDGYLAIEHFDVEEQEKCMRGSAEFLRKVWELV